MFAWPKQRTKNKNRCFVSGVWRHASSCSCWVILAEGHFPKNCKLSELLPGKWNGQNERSQCGFSLAVCHPNAAPKRMLLCTVCVYEKLSHFSDSSRITYMYYKRAKVWRSSTRHHFHSTPPALPPLTSQVVEARVAWCSKQDQKTTKYSFETFLFFFRRALCWQLDLLLDCRSSFLGSLEEKQMVDPSCFHSKPRIRNVANWVLII